MLFKTRSASCRHLLEFDCESSDPLGTITCSDRWLAKLRPARNRSDLPLGIAVRGEDMLQFRSRTRSPKLCDGVTRREMLHVGALGALGLSMPQLMSLRAASAAAATPAAQGNTIRLLPAKAQSCILVYLFGGPSQLDTFDMKPEAPVECRGPFCPIATSVPGLEICEHFPLLARQMDKMTVIRSMHHRHPRHGYGLYYHFTGRPHARPDLDAAPSPSDFPAIGPLVNFLRPSRAEFPQSISLPRWNRFLDLPDRYAGETAGFLGKSYESWLIEGHKGSGKFHVAGVELPEGVTPGRLAGRRDLLQQLDRGLAQFADDGRLEQRDTLYQQSFALIASRKGRAAFDLSREPEAMRRQYGKAPFGQGLLLARRLVEAGTSLVTVNWHDDGSDVKSPFWDTHKDNFNTLSKRLIPPVDRGLSALLNDLEQRGLLDSTLVVVMGEFGRTPRIGRVVMNASTDDAGRDHWPFAYSVLMAGAGIRRGYVHGASDNRAAHVVADPVSPPDLVATIMHQLGIDLRQTIVDRQGRPHPVTIGTPVTGVLA